MTSSPVIPPTNVEELFSLYEGRGHERYGEAITQLQHALQCAALARAAGADDNLVAAALFHDVGHLVIDVLTGPDNSSEPWDDDHEAVVAQPVALHVTAKRWRCTREPEYYDTLSPASQVSLKAQGGLLSELECDRFEAHPGFIDALALRRWDDTAKAPDLEVGSLDDYWEMINSLAAGW
jgi:predicted HD phosphohydrolase